MVDVAVKYSSADNCPGPISCSLGVTSNEPVNSTGDGNTVPDWIIVNSNLVQLRSERKGNGDGRIYTIAVTCRDQYGNASTNTTTVTVPHDMGKGQSSPASILNERATGAGLSVRALQNPSRNYFTLNIIGGNNSGKINIKLFDLSGRVVESNNNISAGQVLNVGTTLQPGVYFLQLQQGKEIKRMKLIKSE
jgi:hypothetical protein